MQNIWLPYLVLKFKYENSCGNPVQDSQSKKQSNFFEAVQDRLHQHVHAQIQSSGQSKIIYEPFRNTRRVLLHLTVKFSRHCWLKTLWSPVKRIDWKQITTKDEWRIRISFRMKLLRVILYRFRRFSTMSHSVSSRLDDVIKSPADKKEYRALQLQNGLKVLLISG